MERLRNVADITPEQTGEWEYFKQTWDDTMARIHGESWAELFAQIIQEVLEKLQAGKTNALSMFMHDETRRVLSQTPVLVLPGIS